MNLEETEAKEIRNIIDNIVKGDKMAIMNSNSNASSTILSGEEQRKSTMHRVSRKQSKVSTGSNQPLKINIKQAGGNVSIMNGNIGGGGGTVSAGYASRRTSIKTLNNSRSVSRAAANRLLSSQTTSAVRKSTNVNNVNNANNNVNSAMLRSQSIRKSTMPLKKKKTLAISLANNEEGNQAFELKDETENETTIDV